MTEPNPDEPAHVETKAVILMGMIGLLIVAFVLYVMYARGVFEPTEQLVLVTDNSEGVRPGMDMTFAGFPIGRVRRVELAEDGKVRIIVDVPTKEAKWLRTSSIFTLESSIVGETRLRAYTGVLTDPPLQAGASRPVLRGDAQQEIQRLIGTLRQLVENMETMTQSGSHIDNTLAHLDEVTARMSGRYGLLGGALGDEKEARKLLDTLERVNALVANADRRVFGKNGVVDDTHAAIAQLNGMLQDARATLKKVDAVLAEAQAVAVNAKGATQDLGALRGEVEASLRKVNRLVDEINRKWPFARDTEVKLP